MLHKEKFRVGDRVISTIGGTVGTIDSIYDTEDSRTLFVRVNNTSYFYTTDDNLDYYIESNTYDN